MTGRLFIAFWWLLLLGSAAAVLVLDQTTGDEVVSDRAQFGPHFTLRDLFVFSGKTEGISLKPKAPRGRS
jgi:hypothetical protein